MTFTKRKPLVIGSDGLRQQIQAGDMLDVPVTTTQIRAVTNGESSTTLVIGNPVYASAAGAVKQAKANAKATSNVVGLIYDETIAAGAVGYVQTDDVFVATTTQWDAVAGTTDGLVFNTPYFLDPTTAGKLTATPASTTGHCNVYIGTALSTTELDLSIEPPILL